MRGARREVRGWKVEGIRMGKIRFISENPALVRLSTGAGTNGQAASPPRPPLNRRAVRTKALPRPHTGAYTCCGTSPASTGLRACSAGVYVRADAAGWSRRVAERSATDATLKNALAVKPRRGCGNEKRRHDARSRVRRTWFQAPIIAPLTATTTAAPPPRRSPPRAGPGRIARHARTLPVAGRDCHCTSSQVRAAAAAE